MRVRILASLVTALVALSACGGDDNDAVSGSSETTISDDAESFPVTVAAANSDVTIAERPERIVSLSPTATEMLFAIGAGDQVVAVDDQSDYPPEVPTTALSGFEPNVEAIASQDPDLVVMSDDAVAGELASLEIPLLVEPAVPTVKEALEQMEQLGEATGNTASAESAVAEIQSSLDRIVDSLPEDQAPLSFYHELDDTYFSATSGTFIGALYEMAGLENIADEADDGSDYPQLSAEYIVDADPDIVFLADSECCSQNAQTVAARPGWDQITAVRNGSVVELGDDVASRWGPRMVDLLELIVAGADQARAAA
jgi:iron complex transport system substrate-binding protein